MMLGLVPHEYGRVKGWIALYQVMMNMLQIHASLVFIFCSFFPFLWASGIIMVSYFEVMEEEK